MYVIAWFVFATYDFRGSDTIVDYNLYPVSDPQKGFPKMLSGGATIYRISGQMIVSQISGDEPTRYSDCAVIDIDNWVCTYDDKSGKFGFRDGAAYTEPDTSIFGGKIKRVSRFQWVWNKAEWWLAEEGWMNKATILFLPFFV
jgi:hypothetical protein